MTASGQSIVLIRHLAYVTLCRWPSGMQVWIELRSEFHPNLHTRRSPTNIDIFQMTYWYNWLSWWWAHDCSKHVEYRNKHIRKIIVRQVGYLQELNGSLIKCDKATMKLLLSAKYREFVLDSIVCAHHFSFRSTFTPYLIFAFVCSKLKYLSLRFPALPDFLSSSGSGTGSTQPREVNWGATWIKSSGSGLENRD